MDEFFRFKKILYSTNFHVKQIFASFVIFHTISMIYTYVNHQHPEGCNLHDVWFIYKAIIRAFYSKLCWYFKMDSEKTV